MLIRVGTLNGILQTVAAHKGTIRGNLLKGVCQAKFSLAASAADIL